MFTTVTITRKSDNPNEFNRANVAWAESILSQPEYTMPNGKPSHQVAYEILNETLDAMVDTLQVNAWGQWK